MPLEEMHMEAANSLFTSLSQSLLLGVCLLRSVLISINIQAFEKDDVLPNRCIILSLKVHVNVVNDSIKLHVTAAFCFDSDS